MIVSKNNKPTLIQFRKLMNDTDDFLNSDAVGREKYYSTRNGVQLESDVFDALCLCAKNTPFENSIELVSGSSFPDIVANKYYGVEVKSTNKNHWKSIGSSILESTRNSDVERIFLTFGKLASPVRFMSRPYEECLSGISVTHYPRYQIDMKLNKGETIFDKIGIKYDVLRKMDNPIKPVSDYYTSLLKPGERLWWATNPKSETITAPPIVRLWNTLTSEEKTFYTVKGYSYFPEIVNQKNGKKYERYALWLAVDCGIVNTNIRDQFSAGGKFRIHSASGTYEEFPAAYGRIIKNCDTIKETILSEDESVLCEYWKANKINKDRIEQWCRLVSVNDSIRPERVYDLLKTYFV